MAAIIREVLRKIQKNMFQTENLKCNVYVMENFPFVLLQCSVSSVIVMFNVRVVYLAQSTVSVFRHNL